MGGNYKYIVLFHSMPSRKDADNYNLHFNSTLHVQYIEGRECIKTYSTCAVKE